MAARASTVSAVYDGPARSISIRLIAKAGLSAIASCAITNRRSGSLTVPPGLCGGRPAGTNRIRSSFSDSRASSAMARCPMWIGSNVPPITPSLVNGSSPARSPGLGLPLELDRAEANGVTWLDARASELLVRAQAFEIALEPLGGLLDLEVRLGGDPLDPTPGDAVRTVGLACHGHPIRCRVDPVHDHPRGLRIRVQLAGRREQLRERGAEVGDALARRRGDRHGVQPVSLPCLAESRPGLRRGRDVDLVERDERRLLEQRRVVRLQLVADHVEVPAWVTAGAIDHLDEHARPLDMPEERVTQAGAHARALDEPGHVGDRRAAPVAGAVRPAEVHDAEVRLECRERVVRDLGAGRGHRGEQGRLPGVRQPDEANVGDEPQLQPDPALLAGLAFLGVLRRLVRGGREVGVAEPAAAAARRHGRLAGGDEVRDQLACRVVEDGGPWWDGEHDILARLPVPAHALAPASGWRAEVMLVLEVAERGLARV